MDWEKINFDKVPKSRRIKAGSLSVLDYAKLTVASKLIEKSLASVVQTAILTYLARNWAAHEERLIVEAKQRSMSPEEYFEVLLGDEPESE